MIYDDEDNEKILRDYLKSNSKFHRSFLNYRSGNHSYPCAIWDNFQVGPDRMMHSFAHGMLPKNWGLF